MLGFARREAAVEPHHDLGAAALLPQLVLAAFLGALSAAFGAAGEKGA